MGFDGLQSIMELLHFNRSITDLVSTPALERELTIKYNSAFPHEIMGWEDTHYSGYGEEKKIQTSKAVRLKTIKTDYWNQNHNKDAHWRKKLALE